MMRQGGCEWSNVGRPETSLKNIARALSSGHISPQGRILLNSRVWLFGNMSHESCLYITLSVYHSLKGCKLCIQLEFRMYNGFERGGSKRELLTVALTCPIRQPQPCWSCSQGYRCL